MNVRPGAAGDAPAVARLHAEEIPEGFLSLLGPAFLTRLYRRVVAHPGSFLVVADDDGTVAGFAAGTESLPALYRSFVARDGPAAALAAGPRLLRSWPRVRESRRYAGATAPAPAGELVAVAVGAGQRRKGLGRALVDAVTAELARRGTRTVRVVTSAGNEPALALYRACGFGAPVETELHRGTRSVVLTWP